MCASLCNKISKGVLLGCRVHNIITIKVIACVIRNLSLQYQFSVAFGFNLITHVIISIFTSSISINIII